MPVILRLKRSQEKKVFESALHPPPSRVKAQYIRSINTTALMRHQSYVLAIY